MIHEVQDIGTKHPWKWWWIDDDAANVLFMTYMPDTLLIGECYL